MMPFMDVNPKFQPLLQQLGLVRPEDVLDLNGPIITGHPGRNVTRVSLGATPPLPDGARSPDRSPAPDRRSPFGTRGRPAVKPGAGSGDPAPTEDAAPPLHAFLKREHVVFWRDRLTNALAG